MAWLRDLSQDVLHGLRVLARQRGATAVAVLALALGTGANSAIFSVVDTVLLQPLPYRQPDRLVAVRESIPDLTEMLPLTELEYFELRNRSRSFERVVLAAPTDVTLIVGDEPETLKGARVTPDFFSLLGVQPGRGRAFTAQDAEADATPTVILGHGLWRRRFGSDRDLVGKTIRLEVTSPVGAGSIANRFTVIGILPPSFRSPFEEEEVWLPMALTEASANRRFHGNFLLGRLSPGADVERARAEVSAILAEVEPQHPIHQKPGRGVTVMALPDLLVRNFRAGLLILSAAVGLVLLIACANVANLQLAQALAREREMVLRASIGASRTRLARQTLTESLLLAAAGGALGLALAWGLLRLLVASSAGDIPRLDEVAIDGRLLAFTLAVSLATGVLFGLVPAWRASRPRLNEVLKSGGRAGSGLSQERLRGALVVAEIGLALLVLVGAGLLLRSFRGLQRTDYGFRPAGVLVVDLSLPQSRYPEVQQQEAFFRRVLERIQGMPGVRGAGLVNALPLTRFNTATTFEIAGRAPAEDEVLMANYRLATPGYFAVMGVPVVAGRGLAVTDLQSPPYSIVVDQNFARTYFPDRGAVGGQLVLQGIEHPVTIVGVVGNVQHKAMNDEARPTFYLPWLNAPAMTFVVRTATADPLALAADLRRLVRTEDRDQPVTITALQELVDDAIARPRFNTLMLGLLAGLALLLSLVGIYAVMSYSVRQRYHEIGIRMALGATSRQVVSQVLSRGLGLAVLGVLLGIAAALLSTRWLESQLFGVSRTDAATYAGTALLLFAVSLLAIYIPARRAARVDPTVTLRNE